MKILKLFLSVFLFFIIQMALFSKLNIGTYYINLGLVLITLQAMGHLTSYRAPYAGALFGLLLDIFLNTFFGISITLLFGLGILAEKIYSYLNSDSFLSSMIMVSILTISHNLMFGLVYKLMGRDFSINYILERSFSWEILYNSIIILIFYFLMEMINSKKILRNEIYD